MAKDYGKLPVNAVRRADREVTEEAWIKQFLHSAAVGALATVYDDQPFINTNLFVYDESAHCIYTHTARVGRTQANVAQHQKVCFSIMAMGRMLPADVALEFSVEYAGVMVFGTASIVQDDVEATYALQLLLNKYAPHLKPGQDYRPPVQEELKRTAVYCINIEEWSGKKKEVEADFPGAFWYNEQPILKSLRQP
ncbi:MAG: 5-nitroimidazole antibiotic resistance protein NimA [Phototrophicales bacterium]